MFAVEFVKVAIVGGVMLGTVPPVPVAALGDQKFFIRQLALFLRRARRSLLVKIAGMVEVVPRLVILGRSNPNVKVGVDPRPANERRQMTGSLMARYRF